MLAVVPSWLTDIGVLCGVVVALGAATKVPVINRPGRWLWRRNVAGPLAAWFSAVIRHTMEPDVTKIHGRIDDLRDLVAPMAGTVQREMKPNGGKSMKDQVCRIAGDPPGTSPAPPG